MPSFGQQTGSSQPSQHSALYGIRVAHGQKPQAGKKRKRGEASDTFVSGSIFNSQDQLVGGRTFRAKNQHEGLPTALAEAYSNGAKDKVEGLSKYTSQKSSGAPWDSWTTKAYDAGYKLGNTYSPLTNADALRSRTDRTVLVSPEWSSSGDKLSVAGFHPSPLSTSVSESTYAHQKTFAAQASVLELRAAGAISSNDAADIALAAVHLASLAPGEYAAHAAFGATGKSVLTSTGALLPDKPGTYEDRREHLKYTIASRGASLGTSDRTAINAVVDAYLTSVTHSTLPAGVSKRRLGTFIKDDKDPAITSPLRVRPTPSVSPPALQLGAYEAPGQIRLKNTVSITEAAFPFHDT